MKLILCILLLWFLFISEEILEGEGAKKSKNKACNSKKNPEKCKSLNSDGLPKVTSFEEWANWSSLYPSCNPENNMFLSPINIETKNAIRVYEQTLIVHAGEPVDTYTYSSLYKVDDVSIEAVNIGLRNDEVYREATYITGLGNPEYRFFQKLMILFTHTDVENERSLHQIDGKKYPMELVFFFQDLQKTDQTQIHVMVEFNDVVNPIWSWLPDATLQLNQQLESVGTDNESKDLDAAKAELEIEKKKLAEMEEEEKEDAEEGYEATYRDLELLYTLVSSAENTKDKELERDKMTNKLNNLKKIETEVRDKIPTTEKLLQDAINEVERQKNAGELQRGQENSATDEVAELKENKEGLIQTQREAHDKVLEYITKLHDLNNDINGKKALLKKYRIGKGEGNQFKSVKDVNKQKKAMSEKFEALKRQRERTHSARDEVDTKAAMAPRNVNIPTRFQVSWMLPPIGGYYRYNGSSMVPPCKKRNHVIVMEKPITMEKLQFALFTQIHKGRKQEEVDSFNAAGGDFPPYNELEGVDRMIPPIRELGNRQIWYNKKNLQFKLDDGFHMMSSLRRKIKDEALKSCGTIRVFELQNMLLYIVVLFIYNL